MSDRKYWLECFGENNELICYMGCAAYRDKNGALLKPGKIRLLPAWSNKWNVDFKLHAPQQTVAEGKFPDGRVLKLKTFPESRQNDVIITEPYQKTGSTFQ